MSHTDYISEVPKCKDYDFSESIYEGYDNSMKVKCKKHGYFTTTPHRLLSGEGCRFCGIENSAKIRTKSPTFLFPIFCSSRPGRSPDRLACGQKKTM